MNSVEVTVLGNGWSEKEQNGDKRLMLGDLMGFLEKGALRWKSLKNGEEFGCRETILGKRNSQGEGGREEPTVVRGTRELGVDSLIGVKGEGLEVGSLDGVCCSTCAHTSLSAHVFLENQGSQGTEHEQHPGVMARKRMRHAQTGHSEYTHRCPACSQAVPSCTPTYTHTPPHIHTYAPHIPGVGWEAGG